MKTCAFFAAAAIVFAASTASAQVAPHCEQFQIIRTSQIKPGQEAAFRKAVADHQAWYVAHGYSDKILAGFVMTMAPGADTPQPSPGMAMTIHVTTEMKAPSEAERQDAGWKAYVAEYNASSAVTATTMACINAVH